MRLRLLGAFLLVGFVLGGLHAEEEEEGDQRALSPILSNPLNIFKPLVWELQRLTMKTADAVNKNKPFEDFTRPPEVQDDRPLREKARLFEEEINKDFLRDSNRLFWQQIPNDLGDMAIWQGYYAAFRAFQYSAAPSEKTRQYLSKAMDGMALFQAGYGKSYFVRGVDPQGGDAEPHRFSRKGDAYNWVEDASGSSFVGYVFGLYCAYRYGDPENRKRAAELAGKLARNLVKNKYALLNSDGSKTRWGNHNPSAWVLAPQRVLGAIALLDLAHEATGDSFFFKEKRRIMSHNSVRNIAARGEAHLLFLQKAHHQHLVYMAYYVLLGTEKDPKDLGLWSRYLKKLDGKFNKQGNTFFTFIYGTYFPMEPRVLNASIQTLHEFSFPKQRQKTMNSEDLYLSKAGRWSLQPIPVWRRPNTDIVWQRDPYALDGNKGNRYTGLDFLIAYWMGRQLKVITPQD